MLKLISVLLLWGVLFIPTLTIANEPLTISTIDRKPFAYHDANQQITGFSIELWEKIAKELKLDYTYQVAKTFSELTSNVFHQKSHLAVANISVTSDREKEADFSYSIFESGMAIAVKKGASPSLWSLILDSGIFTFLGLAFLILLFVAHVIWYFERNIEAGETDYFRDDYRHGIWDAFWWAFIVMTTGGLDGEVSKRILNRILAGIWIVASLFFISTLTAKITTSMTIAELKTDIESYHDLAGKKVGVTEGSSHQRFLSKKGIRTISYTTLDDMYTALKTEKIKAIVSDFPLLSYHASHDGAEWMMLTGTTFNHESYGFMFREDSPYIESINATLLKVKESGYYATLYSKYFGEK
jgi:polar amino acid transport system substrate-binding protein